MPAADLDAFYIGWNQGCRNTVFVIVAYQVIRIIQLECEAKYGGDRRKRDVTLAPVQLDARDGLAVPLALAHDAGVDQGRGIRACLRRGQSKTGDF